MLLNSSTEPPHLHIDETQSLMIFERQIIGTLRTYEAAAAGREAAAGVGMEAAEAGAEAVGVEGVEEREAAGGEAAGEAATAPGLLPSNPPGRGRLLLPIEGTGPRLRSEHRIRIARAYRTTGPLGLPREGRTP